MQPLHDFSSQPADRELAAELSRPGERGVAPHQIVDRLSGAPAEKYEERGEGKNFGSLPFALVDASMYLPLGEPSVSSVPAEFFEFRPSTLPIR